MDDERDVKQFKLLPPDPGLCQTCGYDHPAGFPHNPDSIYYQIAFSMEHDGRLPTWKDAMADCSDYMKETWTQSLRDRGLWVE